MFFFVLFLDFFFCSCVCVFFLFLFFFIFQLFLFLAASRYLIFHLARFTKNNFYVEKNPTIVNFPVKNLELKDCEYIDVTVSV